MVPSAGLCGWLQLPFPKVAGLGQEQIWGLGESSLWMGFVKFQLPVVPTVGSG